MSRVQQSRYKIQPILTDVNNWAPGHPSFPYSSSFSSFHSQDAFHSTNKEHKSRIQRMEQKFFEEKMRLQQEANQKIAELAERAHTEAIKNLDETTRDVYKGRNEIKSLRMCNCEIAFTLSL